MTYGYVHDEPAGEWLCTCDVCSQVAGSLDPAKVQIVIKMASGERLYCHGPLLGKINTFIRNSRMDGYQFHNEDEILEVFLVQRQLNNPITSADRPLVSVRCVGCNCLADLIEDMLRKVLAP